MVYLLGEGAYSFSGAFDVIFENTLLVILLIGLGIINGYVEGWYVHKKVTEATNKSGKRGGTISA